MRAYSSGRPPVDSSMETGADGTITWGMERGPAKIRFIIEARGERWHELGEMSVAGRPWTRFFEMRFWRFPRGRGGAPSGF
jgi:hypothetical protein